MTAYLTDLLRPAAGAPDAGVIGSYELALRQWDKLSREHPTADEYRLGLAQAYDFLGRAYFRDDYGGDKADKRKAREYTARACELYGQSVGAQSPTVYRYRLADGYARLGSLEIDHGRALEDCQRAGALYEELLKEALVAEDPAVPYLRSRTAAVWCRVGGEERKRDRPGDGLAAFERALELRRQEATAAPQDAGAQKALSIAHYYVGEGLAAQGRKDEAAKKYQQAIDTGGRWAGPGAHFEFIYTRARSQYLLAKMRADAGEVAAALALFGEAADGFAALARLNPRSQGWKVDLGNSYYHLGELYRQTGQALPAAWAYARALAVRDELLRATENPGRRKAVVEAWYNLGEVFEQLGLPTVALGAYRRATALARPILAKGPPKTNDERALCRLYLRLADALRRLGAADEADTMLRAYPADFPPRAAGE
jgi:tetratricopeptide (TPR) repeat protein